MVTLPSKAEAFVPFVIVIESVKISQNERGWSISLDMVYMNAVS